MQRLARGEGGGYKAPGFMKDEDFLKGIRPKLKHACNIALLDLLCGYKTRRKESIAGRPHLKLAGNSERETMSLPLKADGKSPDERLQCSDELKEFYSVFDGLRERSGRFYRCCEISAVGEMLDPEDFPGLKKQKDRPIVFAAANGDQLFQTADGKFAWAVVSECKVKKAANSFAELLKKYVAYRAVGDGHPFDSYGR